MVTVDFDDSFNTKVWSVDHIIIVTYINGVLYGGLQKSGKFTSHFWRLLVLYHLYTDTFVSFVYFALVPSHALGA